MTLELETVIEQIETIKYNVDVALEKAMLGTATWAHLTAAQIGLQLLLEKFEDELPEEDICDE